MLLILFVCFVYTVYRAKPFRMNRDNRQASTTAAPQPPKSPVSGRKPLPSESSGGAEGGVSAEQLQKLKQVRNLVALCQCSCCSGDTD